ncbi:MAG: hypothetical protein ABIJ47_09720 [Candidatus Bathyarchaeota archaeon]
MYPASWMVKLAACSPFMEAVYVPGRVKLSLSSRPVYPPGATPIQKVVVFT